MPRSTIKIDGAQRGPQRDLEARGEEFYRHYIALALERTGGVQVKAAELLGMSFRSFRYYVKKYNLKSESNSQ